MLYEFWSLLSIKIKFDYLLILNCSSSLFWNISLSFIYLLQIFPSSLWLAYTPLLKNFLPCPNVCKHFSATLLLLSNWFFPQIPKVQCSFSTLWLHLNSVSLGKPGYHPLPQILSLSWVAATFIAPALIFAFHNTSGFH